MRSAALIVGTTLALLCGASGVARGEDELLREDEADIRHKQGERLFAGGKYHAALKNFKLAYQVNPRPNSLLSIAACQEQLERPREAITTLELYLNNHPKHPGRAKATKKIDELKRLLLLDYGGAGEEQAEEAALLEETPRWPRKLGWAALAVGAVSLVTGTIFSVLASNKANEYEENRAILSYKALSEMERTGELFESVQISTLVIGGLLAAGGVVLVWTFQEPEQLSGQATLAPFVNGADGIGLAAVGRF